MNIPPKYEDVVAQLAVALGREAALREESDRYKSLFNQSEKALDRVHCMYMKRLLDLTGEPQVALVPDEEFVKYFEELKALKRENSALQQRLTVAEQRASALESAAREMLRIAGIANQGSNAYNRAIINLNAALKPAEVGEGS